MSSLFNDLYVHCQSLPTPISSNEIKSKIENLIGRSIKIQRSGSLDTEKCRGLFISCDNKDHPRIIQLGGATDIVVVARANDCWTRIVIVKELMHLFDNPLEWTSCGADFEGLVADFAEPKMQRSPQMEAEIRALWMALALFCPEKTRAAYAVERDKGALSDDEIAQALKIPVRYVPHLFHDLYKATINKILSCK